MPDHRFLIATPTLSDTAEIWATHQVSSMPVTNLQRSDPTRWWRATIVNNLRITMHFTEASPSWDGIFPLYTNFGSEDTWFVSAGATEDAALNDPTFQTDLIPGHRSADLASTSYQWVHAEVWRDSAEWQGQGIRTEPWVVIRIFPRNPKGVDAGSMFVQWGRLFVSEVWQPTYDVDAGSKLGPVSKALTSRTFAGDTILGPSTEPIAGSYKIGFLGKEEANQNFAALDRVRRTAGTIVTIRDVYDLEKMHLEFIHGPFKASDRVHEAYEIYSKDLQIQEMRA